VQDLKKTTGLKSTNNTQIRSRYLGFQQYTEALKTQQLLHDQVVKESNGIVLGVEHPAVLTLGYRAQREQEILAGSELPVVKVERGGLATIHSEGQLVIYPIIHLQAFGFGVRDYVSLLLKTTSQLLSALDIESEPVAEPATGLFTRHGKIAFCGIQIKNGVSLHGISLNVNNDLEIFRNIIPCGVSHQKMDRVANYNKNENLEMLFSRWCEIFNYNIRKRQ
jgi:lipoyl(octanoyl) transferase